MPGNDEARKRYKALQRRHKRAKNRSAAQTPTPVGDRKAADSGPSTLWAGHTLWAWSDTKFATLADVWPGVPL
jgi:hypothetical protein